MPGRFKNVGLFQRVFLIAIPIVVLVCDFLWFPVTFSFHKLVTSINVTSLLTDRVAALGTYNGHTIYVSLDRMDQDDFLDYVKSSPNALVISYFVESEATEPELFKGALARELEIKLKSISPEADRAYVDQLDSLIKRPPGDVSRLVVRIPSESYRRLPIDSVYAVIADIKGESNQGVLFKAIPQTVEEAHRDNVFSLVFPCIGFNWENKNSPTFDEFFAPLFNSLGTDGAPRFIYIPLYSEWPTFTLEQAVKSLNHCWEKVASPSMKGALFSLYRGDYRWSLFFLVVCLFMSSFYAPLTFKNFLIISVSFIAIATAAIKTVDSLTEGHGVTVSAIGKIVTLGFLAVAFPFLVNWNPENVFSRVR